MNHIYVIFIEILISSTDTYVMKKKININISQEVTYDTMY